MCGQPPHSVAAPFIAIGLRAAAKHDLECHLRAHDLPRVAKAKPLVGDLHLPAVTNRLVEDAELVADAVANRRNVEGRERVHVARREAAQSAVAETGLFFLLEKAGQILTELC